VALLFPESSAQIEMKLGHRSLLGLFVAPTLGVAGEAKITSKEKMYQEQKVANDAVESYFLLVDLQMSMSSKTPYEDYSPMPTKRQSGAPGTYLLKLLCFLVPT
jgi:hypothetical protein